MMTSSSSTSGGTASCTGGVRVMSAAVVGVWWLLTNVPRTTDAATPSANRSSRDATFLFNTTHLGDVNSSSSSSSGVTDGWLFDELQVVKLIVLVVVVGILLLSTCTFVLRTFSIFDGKREDE